MRRRQRAFGWWFDDEEVFAFIGRHLHLIAAPSFRFYQTARDHRRAGLDWKALTLRTIEADLDPKLILVARLLADTQYDMQPAPEAARAQAFEAMGGGSRATYHRFKAQLLARRGDVNPQAVEAIKLQPCRPDLIYLAQLNRREQLEQMRREDTGENRERKEERPPAVSDNLSHLRQALDAAIRKEDYEQAARLRDEIRHLERQDAKENGPEDNAKST